MRTWLVPLLAGLAGALGAWGLDGALHDGSHAQGEGTRDPAPAILVPFAEARVLPGLEAAIPLLAPRGSEAAREGLAGASVAWLSDRLAIAWLPPCRPCPVPAVAEVALADPDEPRLGVAGRDTVRVTAHAFAADGSLLASTAPEELPGWPLHGDFTALPQADWHVGAGPAPNGTQPLPVQARPLLDALWGGPVGAVAVVVPRDGAALDGGLAVAAVRIDALPEPMAAPTAGPSAAS